MMNPRFYSRYNTAMPEKSQNQAPGGDEGESMGDTPGELPGAGVAIRRHTDRCFHAIEEVVYDGPPGEDGTPNAKGSGTVLGYIIDGVMIDADDVAEVRHVPDGGDHPACQ